MTNTPVSSSTTFSRNAHGSLPSGSQDDIHILVADDDETSMRIIASSLEQAHYRVTRARDGFAAWEVLRSENPPEIALLDWVMPGYSGPELCTMVAARKDVLVYTVLITSRSDPQDLVDGLEAGAHEFLIKPVNLAEFNARITAAVRLLRYERDLTRKKAEIAAYATRMESLAEARAHQLVHADRINTLGVMSAGIIHEIRNPLTYLSGNSQTLDRYWADLEKLVDQAIEQGGEGTERLKKIRGNTPSLLEGIRNGVGRISRIISGLSRFSHQGTGQKEAVRLVDCVGSAIELSHACWKYHATVSAVAESELPPILVNEQEIVQVLVNLIVNASDAMENREDGVKSHIEISLFDLGKWQQIQVKDNGPGIPEKSLHSIWDPFFTTKEQGKGTGLGLSISLGIISEHGGTVTVTNQPSGGACFLIELPFTQS